MSCAIWRRAASLLAVCVLLLEAGAGLAVEHTTAAVSSPPQSQGLFVSDDQRFPFALLIEAQTPDLYLVRGLGRIAYSADDPTELTVEMQGLGRASNEFTIRGTLLVRPDGKRMTQPQTLPWVGRYDAASDELQLQVSPNHMVGAVRPNAAAAKKDPNAQTAGRAASNPGLDLMQIIAFVTAVHAEHGPTLGRSESTPPATSGNTPPASNGNRSGTSSPRPTANGYSKSGPLADDYVENLLIVMDAAGGWPGRTFGAWTSPTRQPTGRTTAAGPSSASTNSAGSTPTPAKPTGPPLNPPMPRSVDPPQPTDVVGRSLDEALSTLWGRGLNPDSFVNLGPPPDPSQAELVTGITVLPDGRIQVRFYSSSPRDAADAATPRVQGGANPHDSDPGGDTTSTPAANSTAGPARGNDLQQDHSAAPAAPTGFQIGDLATLLEGSDRGQERIYFDGRTIGGTFGRASGYTSVFIGSLSIPDAAAILQSHQQTWPTAKPQSGPGLTVTIRSYSATPLEGIQDHDSDFTGNSGRDGSSYYHYVVYRGFYISYVSHEWDHVAPDLGSPWSTFLDKARQLIDRRFPPRVLGTAGDTP
ncbi:MAG: hypothetical protein WD063_12615 [Pirellulales bacterium]